MADFAEMSEKLAKLQRLRQLKAQVTAARAQRPMDTSIRDPERWTTTPGVEPINQATAKDPYQGPRSPDGPISWKHTKNVAGSTLGGVLQAPVSAANLVGVDTTRAQEKIDSLGDDPGGRLLGQFLVGGVAGKGANLALQGASKGLQVLGKAGAATGVAGRAANAANRVISARPVAGGIEGAVQGALMDKDASEGAETGAEIGVALGMLPAALRMAGQGIVKSRPGFERALKTVQGRTGQNVDVPLAQRIDQTGPVSNAIGGLYRQILPYLPGAKGALKTQSAEAQNALRLSTLQRIADKSGLKHDLPKSSADPNIVERTIPRLKRALTKRFEDTIHKYAFSVTDIPTRVAQRLQDNPVTSQVAGHHPEVTKELAEQLQKHADANGVLSGRALTVVRSHMWNQVNKVDDGNLKQAYREVANALDDTVADDLVRPQMKAHVEALEAGKPSNYKPTAQDWENWQSLEKWKAAREGWGKLMPTERAMAATAAKRGGAYNTPDLVNEVGGKVYGSSLEDEIRTGRELIPEQLTDPSSWARLMALGKSGLGWAGTGLSMGTTVPIARGLAAKSTQKALFGDLAWQKQLADAVRKYGEGSKQVERLVRTGEILGEE